MLADGGEAIADLAVLRDQADVFGSVASTPTAWRLLSTEGRGCLATTSLARVIGQVPGAIAQAETQTQVPLRF